MTRKRPPSPPDDDAIWQRPEVDSPCVKICVIHPEARLCIGCLRSIDEIAQWSRMAPPARRALMADLPARRPDLDRHARTRRGGRAARLARDAGHAGDEG